MKQKEADLIAIELKNLENTFKTNGKDCAVVVANAAVKTVDNMRRLFPMVDTTMNELEIIRCEENYKEK